MKHYKKDKMERGIKDTEKKIELKVFTRILKQYNYNN